MKSKLIILFLLVSVTIFSQTPDRIKILGFGEIPVTKNGNNYSVDFGDKGTFNFTGTLNPLNLEAVVTLEQIENLPGYKIFSRLDLQDINLIVSNDGFEVEANANTQKNLKKLFDFLKIKKSKNQYFA